MLLENLGLAFDIAVATLLVVVIGYAFVLNRKLTLLRDGKEEMALVARDLGESLTKAQHNLDALKDAASGKAEALQAQLDRADSLADDLAFLVRKSDIAAQKLERALVRSRNPLAQDPAPRTGGARPLKDTRASPAAQGANADNDPQGARPLAEKPQEAQDRPVSGLEESRPAARQGIGAGASEAPRSEEESMLLKILQGMR